MDPHPHLEVVHPTRFASETRCLHSGTLTLNVFFCLSAAGLALSHADYMANVSALGSRMGELHHSPSLLGSTDLPFSLDGKMNFLPPK